MSMQLLYLPILIGAMVVLVGLALSLASRPLAGAKLVIVTFLSEALLISLPPLPLGLLIYPQDIVFVLLFASAFSRYSSGTAKLRGARRVVFLLIFLFSVSLLRGFGSHGLKQAGVEARNSFYFLSGIAYFSSFRITPEIRKKLITIWLFTCAVLVGVAIFRWFATLAGLGIAAQWQDVGASEIRVLNAGQAMFLDVGFFASLLLNISHMGPQWQRKLFYVLGPILLLLQHRTVWVVTMVGFLWLGLQEPRFRKKAIGAITAMAVVGIMLTVFVFGKESNILAASLKDAASNDSTFLWRVVGWRQLLLDNPASDRLNDTIGQPFGTGYGRIVGNDESNVSPHNYYIETYLRFGIIGLFLLMWLYAKGIRFLKQIPPILRRYAYPDARFWALVLLLQLTYFLAYGADYELSILAGVAFTGLRLKFVQPMKDTVLPA